MKVGTIGYATQSGLGILAKMFHDHGVVQSILIVPHPHYRNMQEWYPTTISYSRNTIGNFLQSIDTLLLFENALYCDVVRIAIAKGIRVVMRPMYEYTP